MVEDIEKRLQVWLKAKADAELDGFMLPEVFVDRASEYVKGKIKFEDLAAFYDSLLPDKETFNEMNEQYDPGYMDVNIHDPQSKIDEMLQSYKEAPLMLYKGLSIKNFMGMRISLNYLAQHMEHMKGIDGDV